MAEHAVGDVIDRRYQLRREIARGGAGMVFEAVHRITGRVVATKLLRERTSGSAEHQARLFREARLLTLVRHPHIVACLDAGLTEANLPFLVLELLEGRSLEGILAARQRLGTTDAAHVGRQLCEAVVAMHERGIIHRDIKPGNVFVARNEVGHEALKLVDFGIATPPGYGSDSEERKLTQQGAVLGTPEYMAPERLLGAPAIDQRSDLYSIGVTLYECLAGTVPFEGTYGEVLLKTATEAAVPLRSRCPDASPALAAVVEKGIARKPEDRFADARAFAAALIAATGQARGRSSLLGVRAPAAVSAEVSSGQQEPARTAGATARLQPRQRRRYPRAPYVTPVRIARSDGSLVGGRSEDISEGGLLVVTDRECPSDEQVRVRFALPASGTIIEVAATTRWVRRSRAADAAGLEFVSLPPSPREQIRQYVTIMGCE